MTTLLRRGALAGLAGGVVAAVFLLAVGERSISRAIALERTAHVGAPEHEMFSRHVQLAGGAAGAGLVGIAMGLVFSVAFALVRHRMVGSDWHRSARLGLVAFVTVSLVPALKYPPNPPSVGDPSTIGTRTALFLVMVAWSVVATWAAWRLSRAPAVRGWREHQRQALVAAVYVALVAVALLALAPNRDAVRIPAALLWRFRLASLGGGAALWATIAMTFGWLSERAAATAAPRSTASTTAT